ncbi:MAG: phosphotransferase [Actinomycetota bacterium]|nr:phosphotransferase [Actinomycetota bacterium]
MTSLDTPLSVDRPPVQDAPLARGRDATIHPAGAGRVVRRLLDGRSTAHEAEVMTYVRTAGYPVPRVHRVGRGEIELDRVEGPTMLADLLRRPWRLVGHARVLAALHHRLHAIPAPPALRTGPAAGDTVVHLDLHPGNVILGPCGPVVIDWPHAARGSAASDVALTWTSLGCFDHDATGFIAVLADRFRAVFLDRFLAAAGRAEARALLPTMVEYRLAHPLRSRNVRPAERASLQRLAATAR